jgi:hypothetical protein
MSALVVDSIGSAAFYLETPSSIERRPDGILTRTRKVGSWPFASFRVGATVRSLLEKSGHQLAGRTGWLSRE